MGLFPSYSQRELKKINKIRDKVLALDETMQKKSDEELKALTPEFKNRLAKGKTLDDILPEAFAAIREADFRVLGLKPYPVQITGGIILHQGRIAEMKTGEGKTLVTTMPAYLNALEEKGVHVVTVNDYLAGRDKDQMSKVYHFMGLTTSCITQELTPYERQEAYSADITYVTNNELGFDYLRDNMATSLDEKVQRGHAFAIVDEVDSILIDEARTPLIISGPGETPNELYEQANAFVKTLHGIEKDEKQIQKERMERLFVEDDNDYIIYPKQRSVILTENGTKKAEKFFDIKNLTDINNIAINHHIQQALQAHYIMKRDIDYIVKNDEVLIVDTFTGRVMNGRRYSDGLHQAIECKERIPIKAENKTLATITFQNYFKLYKKLAGMSGTVQTEVTEFSNTYNLDIVQVPTNKPIIRIDHFDKIYGSEKAKYEAIAEDVKLQYEKGRPVLIGTSSVEKSENLSKVLKRYKIPHNVLNAKYHEKEAEIIAQAGRMRAVTIATNMAGRGTDILLGGNPDFMAKKHMKKLDYTKEEIELADSFFQTDEDKIINFRNIYRTLAEHFSKEMQPEKKLVKELGGLYVIGTERHDARRIDNQLIGRSGRQGDPGESRFYISAEDKLIKLFDNGRFEQILKKEKSGIESKTLSRIIASAQRKVEGLNEATRKSTLDYDAILNEQRKVIYNERNIVLSDINVDEQIEHFIDVYIWTTLFPLIDQNPINEEFIRSIILSTFNLKIDEKLLNGNPSQIKKKLTPFIKNNFKPLDQTITKGILLSQIDMEWMDHIEAMEQLKQGIGLRAIANIDPVQAYGQEGYEMFNAMTHRIMENTIKILYRNQNL